MSNAFTAGRIKNFIENWRNITSDRNILDCVQHLHIEFISGVNPVNHICFQNNFNEEEIKIVDQEIQKLIQIKNIIEVDHHPDEFISPIFLLKKKNGEYRMILNLKELNKSIVYHHFKMDTFEAALKLVNPNTFFASVDLRHAYYSVPIAEEHQIKLRFEH